MRVAQVDLGHGVQPEAGGHIDQQSEVDAVALHEGELFERFSSAGVLARQRLDDGGQVGEQQRDDGPGHELSHPSAPVAAGPGRSLVEAFHEDHVGPGHQRTDQAHDEGGVEVAHVGVAPIHELQRSSACIHRCESRYGPAHA